MGEWKSGRDEKMLMIAICLLQTMFPSSASFPWIKKKKDRGMLFHHPLQGGEPFRDSGEWAEHTVMLAVIFSILCGDNSLSIYITTFQLIF